MAVDNIVLGTDGSEHSLHALRTGFEILGPAAHVYIVTVVEPADPSLVSGTGFAGGVATPAEYDVVEKARKDDGQAIVERARADLGIEHAETRLLEGDAGPALCAFAAEISAGAIVMGSRGRGGIKRALLGSVSDHVVRNAPCPVVITGPAD